MTSEPEPDRTHVGAAPQQVELSGLAIGGDAVGRLADGRAVFVAGGLPGELVSVRVRRDHRRYAHAELDAVLRASPERVTPPCPWLAAGCGGCDLMHLHPAAQRQARRRLAEDALRRLGRLDDPEVVVAEPLLDHGYRTTIRVGVQQGRAAFRRRSSHDLISVDGCLVAHPALAELLAQGRFGQAREVTLRMGAATGERLALVDPDARGVELPSDVVIVEQRPNRQRTPAAGHYHEVVAGRRWRISAHSFFQTSAVGAEALVATVREALGEGGRGGRVLDAYCGVGLLSAAVPDAAMVVGVESSPSSVADARHNLADRDVDVIEGRVERWRPRPFDAVIADPARAGLGRVGSEVLSATGASALVLVSCDLASLGRDCADLVTLGFRHRRSVLVDLFPHSSHAEVVTTFDRS
ncbi:MAG: class I SAM-dependent RNA methyltransferase [Acidimicrobiales bacterium]